MWPPGVVHAINNSVTSPLAAWCLLVFALQGMALNFLSHCCSDTGQFAHALQYAKEQRSIAMTAEETADLDTRIAFLKRRAGIS